MGVGWRRVVNPGCARAGSCEQCSQLLCCLVHFRSLRYVLRPRRWPPVPWIVVATRLAIIAFRPISQGAHLKRSSCSLKNCGNSTATLCAKASPLPTFREATQPKSDPTSSKAISRCRLEVTLRGADPSLALTASSSGAHRHHRVLCGKARYCTLPMTGSPQPAKRRSTPDGCQLRVNQEHCQIQHMEAF